MAFLILRVRKLSSLVALIFGIYIKFRDLSFLDLLNKFTTILLALLSTSTILLSLALNVFKAKSDNLIVFNNKVSRVAIPLKP